MSDQYFLFLIATCKDKTLKLANPLIAELANAFVSPPGQEKNAGPCILQSVTFTYIGTTAKICPHGLLFYQSPWILGKTNLKHQLSWLFGIVSKKQLQQQKTQTVI